ncbi:helix-turn-helix transcriptional regulator [Nocardiopsis coralliicola]
MRAIVENMTEQGRSVRADLPQRLLRLLSLLQTRRTWTGPELTERLGVSPRTLRRDVERLRSLDYAVESVSGAAGGYRLGPGSGVPPLVLDDEESVAVAVGLTTATGVGEPALRALAKLERILPARLRPRLAAVRGSTDTVQHPRGADVDPAVLGVLAGACLDRAVADFVHQSRSGRATERRVEPHHLVVHGGNWYLLAHDTDRDDWRTFRVDRVREPRTTHRRFVPRELPAPSPAAFMLQLFGAAVYRYTADIALALPAEEAGRRLFGPVLGRIEPDGPGACRVHISADSLDLVCQYAARVASLGATTGVGGHPDAVARLSRMGGQLVAAGPPQDTGEGRALP